MVWTNFHSHCDFCDGHSPLERYIEVAIDKGFPAYGFSSHAPTPMVRPWAMDKRAFPLYLQQIAALRTKYLNQIEVYAGLEIDYVPGVSWWDFHGPALRNLDYTIGSIHLVESFADGRPWEIDGSHELFMEGFNEIFRGDFKAFACRYFELMRWMLMLENPDILGHLDKLKIQNLNGRFYNESDEWYRKEIEKTLKVVVNMGTIVEVNTRGLYSGKSLDLYPSHWILERMHAMRIPVMINSDAHRPEEVDAGFEFAARILHKIGYRKLMVVEGGMWKSVPFDEQGLNHAFAIFKGSQNRTA